MVKPPKLPLPGSVHENSPDAQVVVEQVAVINQEAQRFLLEETVGTRGDEGLQRTRGSLMVPHRLYDSADYHYLMQSPRDLQIPSSTLLCLGLQMDSQWRHLLRDQVQTLLSLKNNQKLDSIHTCIHIHL